MHTSKPLNSFPKLDPAKKYAPTPPPPSPLPLHHHNNLVGSYNEKFAITQSERDIQTNETYSWSLGTLLWRIK